MVRDRTTKGHLAAIPRPNRRGSSLRPRAFRIGNSNHLQRWQRWRVQAGTNSDGLTYSISPTAEPNANFDGDSNCHGHSDSNCNSYIYTSVRGAGTTADQC